MRDSRELLYIIRVVRILHVVPTYVPAWRYGGPIHSVHGLCKALAARGHDIEVATTSVDGPHDLAVTREIPVDVEGVTVRYFRSPCLRRLYYAPRMRGYFRAHRDRWQVVHTHSTFLWPTTAAARFAMRAGIPFVLSPRGMLVPDLIRRRNALLKRAWIALFEAVNIRNAAAIHVTSAAEREALHMLGFTPRMTVEIPNGVEIGAESAPAPPAPAAAYALFLGRISWKKGLDRLVEALAFAPGVSLVVAGNDDENLWPGLERRIAELGLTGRIRRVGYVHGDDKWKLLREASFLVLPSRSENFGNVVLEAMAAGIAVIVTPEVGLAGKVGDSGSGLVVSGEPQAFGAAMAALAADPAARAAMAAKGRATAAGYTWDGVARSMEAAYERVAAARG
jgi:glycosyltransferase involved in cell wall biosynthesis